MTTRRWSSRFAMTFTDDSGRLVVLDRKLGAGGEAEVHSVSGQSGVVAKIYFTHSSERSSKFRAMVGSPPRDPTSGQGHVSICWPKALLFNQAKVCAGFLMHRVDFSTNVPVLQLYNPQDRQQVAPGFNWGYKLRSAANIASVVEAIHACGYVVGDLNESNFLVSDRALVTLVDCDSMQVPKMAGGGFFRCTVGKPDFTPPELQGRDFGQVDRDPTHDNFALGVMIFHLLMEGVHPYAGVWRGRGDPPPLEQRIQSGDCPYVGSANVSPMPVAVPFDILPPSLKALVVRCFGYGHKSPQTRPSAHEWRDALNGVERNLNTCPANRRHVYANHLPACPWCERTVILSGFDPFPSVSKQQPLTASPFISTPPKPIRVATPSPPVPASPGPPPSPSFPPAQQLKPIRTPTPISIGSVIGAGMLGSLLLGLSGCTVLFFGRISTAAGRDSILPFGGAYDNPFWMIGFFAGVACRLLSRISRQAAVVGMIVVVVCSAAWYGATRRQPIAVSPTPQYSPPANTVGKRKKVPLPQSTPAPPVPSQATSSPLTNQPIAKDAISAPALETRPVASGLKSLPKVQDGDAPSSSQTPQMALPTVVAFEAVPSPVEQCAVAILRWTVKGASSASIDPEVGNVDPSSGYKVVRPIQTTRYTLRAEGPGGSVSRDVTLSVVRATRASCGQ